MPESRCSASKNLLISARAKGIATSCLLQDCMEAHRRNSFVADLSIAT